MLESYIDKDGAKNGSIALPNGSGLEGGAGRAVLLLRSPQGTTERADSEDLSIAFDDAA